MLVDRTNAEVTAAGQGYLRLVEASEQSAQKIVGGAHLAHAVLGRLPCVDRAGIDIEGVLVDAANHRAHIPQDVGDQADVGYIRYIFNAARLVAQNNAGDDRHGGVLGAADSDLSEKRLAACDNYFLQSLHSLRVSYC